MKRGKDDEKAMGPMFPRLHVNDTDKGGPRAPPRNKMALYEQLTIPSHSYSSGVVPLNLSNNSNLVPSTSTNQGTGRENNMYFPVYQPPPAPSYDDLPARNADAVSSSSHPQQGDSQKKPLEDDDFTVPIFSLAGKEPCKSKTQDSLEGETQEHLNSSYQTRPLSNDHRERNRSDGGQHSKHDMNHDGRSLGGFDASTRHPEMSTREKDGGRGREDASVQGEHPKEHRLSNLKRTDSCLHQDIEDSVPAMNTRCDKDASVQALESAHQGVSFSLKHNPRVGSGFRDINKVDHETQGIVDSRLLVRENLEKGDDVSETSMVDCTSGLDISPDDVVGVLGRKHFWKARTAIVNQQRVFAVQVFELHRLIKVQKLIAGSPDLLLESTALLEKATLNRSSTKQLSSEYAVNALAHNLRQKDDSQKLTDKLEGTAENAVTKAAIPPSQNAIQTFPVSPAPSPSINTDPKMNPWGGDQQTGHQWLVPVMSPSEGLIYKPYPAPGFMGPVWGGWGPPIPGNLMNPSPYQQSFGGQGYFFPYGMPMMSLPVSGSAVDQTNPFSSPNAFGQMGQAPAGGSINLSAQHQSSCNMPNPKKGTTPPPDFRASHPKGGELQGSTASSPCDRAKESRIAPPPSEGTDALPRFPMACTLEASEADPQTENPARVIKVVPHNARSTKESAARIFQSIQEERQRHNPVSSS